MTNPGPMTKHSRYSQPSSTLLKLIKRSCKHFKSFCLYSKWQIIILHALLYESQAEKIPENAKFQCVFNTVSLPFSQVNPCLLRHELFFLVSKSVTFWGTIICKPLWTNWETACGDIVYVFHISNSYEHIGYIFQFNTPLN